VIRSNSAWPRPQIEHFLRSERIPVRLACLTSHGGPIVCSLWYLYDDCVLWCATQKSARVVSYLTHHPVCGFEVAPEAMPYKGVRGQGKVSLSQERGLGVLQRLIDRYLGNRESEFARWLIKRGDKEVAIRIEPTWLTAWDFTPRMKSAQTP